MAGAKLWGHMGLQGHFEVCALHIANFPLWFLTVLLLSKLGVPRELSYVFDHAMGDHGVSCCAVPGKGINSADLNRLFQVMLSIS